MGASEMSHIMKKKPVKQTRENWLGTFKLFEKLTQPGLKPKTSGLRYQCSSIWAIQPLDGGPPE